MTPGHDNTVNLDRLGLLSGQARQLKVPVELGPIELGGHRYVAVPDPAEVLLDVSRTVAGYAMRVRFTSEVDGPCMRCLEPAANTIEIDAREVDQPLIAEDGEDEGELSSPYVSGGDLALGAWTRDALVLALPDPFLCREDCAGLCPVCGEPLAGAEPGAHQHETATDPRWAALDKLKLDS